MLLVDLVAETPRAGGTGPLRERVGLVAVGLVVFLAACLALGAVLPRDPTAWTTTKLEHLERHKDEFDLLFVGSSQIYRHLDPILFDEVMASRGHPVRSFNFGIVAMAAVETHAVLEEILAMEPSRLRWIVLDCQRMGLGLSGNNHLTGRVISWHDPSHTWRALALLWELEDDPAWKREVMWKHVVAAGYHLANVGRLRLVLEPFLAGTAATRATEAADRLLRGKGGLGAEGRGYVSLSEEYRTVTGYERKLLIERLQAWHRKKDRVLGALAADPDPARKLLKRTGEPRRLQRLTDRELDVFADIVRLVREAGVEPVFINSPDVFRKEFFLAEAVAAGVVPTLIDMDDPARYPELFSERLRFDDSHLNERGARIYTEALAHRFADWLETEP